MLKPLRIAAVLATPVPGAAFAHANCADRNKTAFFEAASAGDVQACLDAGADIGARTGDGETPLDLAKQNRKLTGTDAYRRLNDAQSR